MFVNLTSLSKLHLQALKELCGKYHLMALAEHKVPEDLIEGAQAKFSAMGMKSWWTQAIRTGAGVSGGTSVHAKKYFKAHRS